jgi:predicted metal-binding protein
MLLLRDEPELSPPHGPGIEEARRIVDRYGTGLFIMMKVPLNELTG